MPYSREIEEIEISNYTAEQWESRPDYAEVMAEMNESLPDGVQEDAMVDINAEGDWAGIEFEDYEPSPYDGTFSEE